MKISISKSWNYAIVVTKHDLEKLERIISEHYKVKSYTAECIDETKIECFSLEELLNYENSSTRRIDSISIAICDDKSRYIGHIKLRNDSKYRLGPSCNFQIEDTENSHINSISQEVEQLVKDLKQWYSWLLRFEFFTLVIILFTTLGVISAWYVTLFVDQNEITTESNSSFVFKFFLLLPIIALFGALLFYLNERFKWLFPRVFFALGRQEKELEKRTTLRNWIIGTLVAGVIIPVIFSVLPELNPL